MKLEDVVNKLTWYPVEYEGEENWRGIRDCVTKFDGGFGLVVKTEDKYYLLGDGHFHEFCRNFLIGGCDCCADLISPTHYAYLSELL